MENYFKFLKYNPNVIFFKMQVFLQFVDGIEYKMSHFKERSSQTSPQTILPINSTKFNVFQKFESLHSLWNHVVVKSSNVCHNHQSKNNPKAHFVFSKCYAKYNGIKPPYIHTPSMKVIAPQGLLLLRDMGLLA